MALTLYITSISKDAISITVGGLIASAIAASNIELTRNADPSPTTVQFIGTPTKTAAVIDLKTMFTSVADTDKFRIVIKEATQTDTNPEVIYVGLSSPLSNDITGNSFIDLEVKTAMPVVINPDMVKLQRYENNRFIDIDPPSIKPGATATTATIDLSGISGHAAGDVYRIILGYVDTTSTPNVLHMTNPISVKVAATLNSDFTTNLNYVPIEQAGKYDIQTLRVNDRDITITSGDFTVAEAPTGGTITIANPNLVKFVGHSYNVTLKLDGITELGGYSIVYSTIPKSN